MQLKMHLNTKTYLNNFFKHPLHENKVDFLKKMQDFEKKKKKRILCTKIKLGFRKLAIFVYV